MFISCPPSAQGAKPHYDTCDVFVLQVVGSKEWTIYGTPVKLSLPGQEFDAAVHELGAPSLQLSWCRMTLLTFHEDSPTTPIPPTPFRCISPPGTCVTPGRTFCWKWWLTPASTMRGSGGRCLPVLPSQPSTPCGRRRRRAFSYSRSASSLISRRHSIDFALSHVKFKVADLLGELDDAAGKLTLIRRLIRGGLVAALVS